MSWKQVSGGENGNYWLDDATGASTMEPQDTSTPVDPYAGMSWSQRFEGGDPALYDSTWYHGGTNTPITSVNSMLDNVLKTSGMQDYDFTDAINQSAAGKSQTGGWMVGNNPYAHFNSILGYTNNPDLMKYQMDPGGAQYAQGDVQGRRNDDLNNADWDSVAQDQSDSYTQMAMMLASAMGAGYGLEGAFGGLGQTAPAWGEISANGIGGGGLSAFDTATLAGDIGGAAFPTDAATIAGQQGVGSSVAGGLGQQVASGYGGVNDVPVNDISYGDPGFQDTQFPSEYEDPNFADQGTNLSSGNAGTSGGGLGDTGQYLPNDSYVPTTGGGGSNSFLPDWVTQGIKDLGLTPMQALSMGAGAVNALLSGHQPAINAGLSDEQKYHQTQIDHPGTGDYGHATVGPLGRAYTPFTGDMKRYGVKGGEHQFFSPVVPVAKARGGLAHMEHGHTSPLDMLHDSSTNHEMVRGLGGGQDDQVPARLSPGEFVWDADTVSALGDGSSEEGARRLDRMRERIRAHKRSAPASRIPPKAKAPEDYLRRAA